MVGSAIESILSSVGANVTPIFIPRNRASKWVAYTMISMVPHNTKSGASDYDQYRFQIDCFAKTHKDTDTLAASVRSALDEYTGTVESVVIDHVFYDGEFDGYERIEDRDATEDYFRRTQDYIIFVKT